MPFPGSMRQLEEPRVFLLEHKEIRSHFTEVKHIELKSVS